MFMRLLIAFLLVGLGTVPVHPRPLPPPKLQPSDHKDYTETIPGTKVRFQMIAICGGAFLMGSPKDEKGRNDDEGPQHPVEIPPFWMGRTEVTWDEYDLFRKGGPTSEEANEKARTKDADAITRPTPTYPDQYRGMGKEGYPVVGVSHHGAMEYCHWLSKKTGKIYRLPTEAEWEYACRAGSKAAYFFGDNPKELGKYAWFEKNSTGTTYLVGRREPNPWGLCDMYGNVAEWCVDHYHKDFYRTLARDKTTLGPVNLPTIFRYPHVVRGGSWTDAPERCRSAARRSSHPDWNKIDPDQFKTLWWNWNDDTVGFRVVRAVQEQESLKGLRSKVTRRLD
jgi:formylglycine-generating enzyme required for sulfatase activity